MHHIVADVIHTPLYTIVSFVGSTLLTGFGTYCRFLGTRNYH